MVSIGGEAGFALCELPHCMDFGHCGAKQIIICPFSVGYKIIVVNYTIFSPLESFIRRVLDEIVMRKFSRYIFR